MGGTVGPGVWEGQSKATDCHTTAPMLGTNLLGPFLIKAFPPNKTDAGRRINVEAVGPILI